MLAAVLLLASLAAPSAAFYPYFMPDPSQPPPPSPTVRSRLTRVKRSNQFSIIQANQPTTPNSVGVDQDGHDYSYMIKMEFGSSHKTLEMLVDTAAVNTWVMASSCTMPACAVHDTFGPADSTTLQVC
jgi:cathepsin D